jgi:hypothetical protein
MTETPAETIRRAAALMRERAEAATPGPWLGVMGMFKDGGWPCVIAAQGDREDAQTWLMGAGNNDSAREANATHAGSWHPLVALAVADVLDNEAHAAELLGEDADAINLPDARILKVARAYLGEAS